MLSKDYMSMEIIMKTVAILGKGTLAIKLCDLLQKSKEYIVTSVTPVIPEAQWTYSFLGCSKVNKYNIYYDHNDIPQTSLVISVFYDKILKPDFLKKHNRVINIHNSPLPLYRGVSPINWALKDNRKTHGITIHDITPSIDDGPIISQLIYDIYPEFDEVVDVYKRALKYGYVLFKNTLPILDKIQPKEQDETKAIYHPSSDNHLLGDRRHFTRKGNISWIWE